MGRTFQLLVTALLLIITQLPLSGCGCGFDCNSNSNDNPTDPALLTLGLSDSLPEDLKEVWIEVDAITFKRSGADAVEVKTFTISGVQVETFKIDLLKFPGVTQLKVIEGLSLPTGTYEVTIKVIANGINSSFVKDANDVSKPITVSGDTLAIPGMNLTSGTQVFTVEFSLAQALSQTSSGYLLATTGMRLENNLTDATLSGTLDSNLFDTVSPCDAKTTPTSGNRVYLYKGIDTAKALTDVFTSASSQTPPSSALAPFAVASLRESTSGEWSYAFGYVPAGDYTMAFSCNTAGDDSIQWNDLVIPLPANQVYNVKLSETKSYVCNLSTAADCK